MSINHKMDNDARKMCHEIAATGSQQLGHTTDQTAMVPVPRSALDWVTSGDTGLSSMTIFAAMTGSRQHATFGYSLPADAADFGRCYRLLKAVPEWRSNLWRVAVRFKIWRSLVEDWDRLERLYEGGCDPVILSHEVGKHWRPRVRSAIADEEEEPKP